MTIRRGRPRLTPEMTLSPFAKRIEARIEELSLSVDAAAKRCGLGPWILYDILRHKTKSPTFAVTIAISRGLGVSLDDLAEASLKPAVVGATLPDQTTPSDSPPEDAWSKPRIGRKLQKASAST